MPSKTESFRHFSHIYFTRKKPSLTISLSDESLTVSLKVFPHSISQSFPSHDLSEFSLTVSLRVLPHSISQSFPSQYLSEFSLTVSLRVFPHSISQSSPSQYLSQYHHTQSICVSRSCLILTLEVSPQTQYLCRSFPSHCHPQNFTFHNISQSIP